MSFGIPVRNGVMLGLTASTALTTRGGFPVPALSLNFLSGTLDSRITFTRALNTATRVNSSGLIETVNANIPRFDYSPVTLQPRGLLIEESRINIRSYSEDFSNAVWAPTNLNQTGTPPWVNAATSPANTLTADKLIANTTNGTHRVVGGAQATSSGSRYAMSIFAKKSEYSKIAIGEFNNGVGWASFNLLTGAVIATGGTGSPTASIEPYKDDWFRCILTFAAGAFSRFDIYALNDAYTNTEPSSYNFTGDNTSGVFIWGADLELGAFATSYIANLATGTTTRNADVATMTGTNFSSWYNQTEGTFVLSVLTAPGLRTAGGVQGLFSVNDGTTSNVMNAARQATRLIRFNGTGSPAGDVSSVATAPDSTASKIGAAYKLNDWGLSLNGATAVTDASAIVPTATRLGIGSLDGLFDPSAQWGGHISALTYFNTRLPNDRLQALTR